MCHWTFQLNEIVAHYKLTGVKWDLIACKSAFQHLLGMHDFFSIPCVSLI